MYELLISPGPRLYLLFGGFFVSVMLVNINETFMVLQALGLDQACRRMLSLSPRHLPLESARILSVQPLFVNMMLWEIRLTYKLVRGLIIGFDIEAACWGLFVVLAFLYHAFLWKNNLRLARRILRDGWRMEKPLCNN